MELKRLLRGAVLKNTAGLEGGAVFSLTIMFFREIAPHCKEALHLFSENEMVPQEELSYQMAKWLLNRSHFGFFFFLSDMSPSMKQSW